MKNKALFEPFLIVFISLFVFAAGTAVTAISPLVVLVAPAFFMILERRQGVRPALLGVCLGSAVLFALADGVSALMYMIAVGLLGVFFGCVAGRAKNGGEFLLASVAASVSVKVFLLTLLYLATGVNLFYISPDAAERIAENVAAVLSSGGLSLTEAAINQYAKNLVDTISVQMPSVLIIFSVFDTFVSYIVSWKIIKKYGGGKIVSLPPFGLWRFPRNVFFAFFVAVIADAVGRMSPTNQTFVMIASNILELLRGLFFLEGLALCWYYMTARGVRRLFKVTAATLCVVFWPVSSLLSGLGFVDIWFDLRKHIRRKYK